MSIIGLSGKARSGKDTLAGYLKDSLNRKYNRDFKSFAFAEVLKHMCQKEFDLDDDQLWGDQKEIPDKRYKKRNGDGHWTAREIMQEVGAFYRTIDHDFWVKKLNEDITYHEDVMVTDVRYINEADFIKKSNGFLIKVVRNVNNEIHGQNHESEINLDGYKHFDLNIDNSGPKKVLEQIADDVADIFISSEKLTKQGLVIKN